MTMIAAVLLVRNKKKQEKILKEYEFGYHLTRDKKKY